MSNVPLAVAPDVLVSVMGASFGWAGSTPASRVVPMTPEECADAVALPIGKYGTTWMLAPETFGPGIEAGFTGLDFYFCGRAGAMGDVDADVVVASIALLGPEATRSNWEAG